MIMVRNARRWLVTVATMGALVVGGAGAAHAGDWEQEGYDGWTPPSWGMPSVGVAVDEARHALDRVPRFEDEPGWSCATMGNRVCGPRTGPNTTDHNVYYGTGALPYIPGRVTTRPDGTSDGPACVDPVFAELGHAVPRGAVVGDCR